MAHSCIGLFDLGMLDRRIVSDSPWVLTLATATAVRPSSTLPLTLSTVLCATHATHAHATSQVRSYIAPQTRIWIPRSRLRADHMTGVFAPHHGVAADACCAAPSESITIKITGGMARNMSPTPCATRESDAMT